MCQKISKQYYDQEHITLDDVEAFNLSILSSFNKPQLYFWIGFLKYKKVGDIQKAKDYFGKFLELSNNQTEDFLRKKTETFLSEIEDELAKKI